MSVLVGKKAPDFHAQAVRADGSVENNFHFYTEIKNKYALLVFYPLDFTFVCPSELIALDHRMMEFKKRNVEVFTVSIDSAFVHCAWRNTPVNKGGIGPVKFNMVADLKHEIARAYDVEQAQAGVALRGTFIIDRENVVRSQIVNDLPVGRNMDEVIRTLDALQFVEEHGEVCPAGWQPGQSAIKPSEEGIAVYLAENAEAL